MAKRVLTLFGGSGFIASEIIYRLHTHFDEVRILTRNTAKCNSIKVIKNVEVYLYDPSVPSTFTEHLKESGVVINTVGILNESKKHSFDSIHYMLAKRIADFSKKNGVNKLIHLSALNADTNAKNSNEKTSSLSLFCRFR